MWIVVLVPPLLRSRAIGRSTSVGDFRRQLSTLQSNPTVRSSYAGGGQLRPVSAYRPSGVTRTVTRPAPAPLAVRSAAMQRRQNILFSLVALAAVTGIAGFGMKIRVAGLANLLVDVLLVSYVYLLVQIKKQQQTRAMRYDWSRAA